MVVRGLGLIIVGILSVIVTGGDATFCIFAVMAGIVAGFTRETDVVPCMGDLEEYDDDFGEEDT